MRALRFIASSVIALALVVGAASHGARAAAMAMPMALAWSAASAEPCELCGGESPAQAAAQCALVCAGTNGVIGEAASLVGHGADGPMACAPLPIAGRSAAPEPDPPR